ncbi:MAG: 2-C-methyl-D-erythritol 4-phosphate cytidylyltransferase, partial [Firmicutes bacterium]|nr:2-C-methyl-D-erythritol 4-phosphate cytidylyltransferase [Bacillota bacterium]
MNAALIIAGGSGKRMGHDIPKQFIKIEGKPIIIYTLEAFEQHPGIDAIEVVCLDGWQEILLAYAEKFGISKLKWLVTGGSFAQESIKNGVFGLRDKLSDDDIVIVHDGIRPMVDDDVLT